MFPFSLPGPQFLVFYTTLGIVTLIVFVYRRRSAESAPFPRVQLHDPYLIACLRGGPKEAVRVAVISLVDRGLFRNVDEKLQTVEDKGTTARKPLERALLDFYGKPGFAGSAESDGQVIAATAQLERQLENDGLLPGPAVEAARGTRLAVTLAVLWVPVLLRLVQAFSRGRHNVVFLLLLAALFGVIAVALRGSRRTARGDSILVDLETLFSGLRTRAEQVEPGGATSEAAILAAVFGLSSAPPFARDSARKLYPDRVRSSDGATSSGCGSSSSCGSSGSSCGSSGGSSCGGGGGGCGGCGGGCGGG